MNDWDLLDQYAADGSEKAFEELVRRHRPLVYGSALRRAGSEHADDIAQAVFMVLARKAGRLSGRRAGSLSGWLFRATRYAASEALRGERRRQQREQAAAEGTEMMEARQEEAEMWQQIKPVLDQALDRLSGKDREALLLRYIQGASHTEVGAAIGLSENAATRRVSRGLEKLRAILAKQGLTVSASAMAALLTAKAAEAGAPGTAVACASAALAAEKAGESGAAPLLAKGLLRSMRASAWKSAAVVTIPVLVASASAVLLIHGFGGREPGSALQVERITPLALIYKARSTMPDGAIEFQLNAKDQARTYFARLGEEAGGFQLLKHEARIYERTAPGIATPLRLDVSELTVSRDGQEMVLIMDQHGSRTPYVAHLLDGKTGRRFQAGEGDVLISEGGTWEVVSVDPAKRLVRVRRLDDGREWSLKAIAR